MGELLLRPAHATSAALIQGSLNVVEIWYRVEPAGGIIKYRGRVPARTAARKEGI